MRIAFVIVALFSLARPVQACSMVYVTVGQRELDREVRVFVGKVTGTVGPYTFRPSGGEASGVRVAVLESVYPLRETGILDVFPFGYDAACETVGSSREALERRFPVGAEVFVVAWPAKDIEVDGDIRPLEVSWKRGVLGIAPISASELASRRVDYASAYRFDLEEFARVFGHDRSVMVFEQQKDFAGLEAGRQN
jgi:hypothetical protein